MRQIGRFELDPDTRTLRCGTERVRIGSRAFDILALLATARGRVVTKDELIHHVWPDTIVEENTLQVHLSALRKALGADRDLIMTLPGRGYQLTGRSADTVQQTAASRADHTGTAPPGVPDDLPLQAGELFGREAAVQEIAALLQQARVVTLAGAGGIGKTSLATAVARQVAEQFPGGVYFVELAAYSEAAAVLTAVADACALVFAGGAVTPARIAAALAGRHCLVVVDNAEHVIEIAADLTEALTRSGSGLSVLTTSREPLRTSAETVFRVPPLDVPLIDAQGQEVLAYSAVRLFLRRARALQPRFADDAASVSLVGEICRRLDGIPLAIELAAARAATLGIDGLHHRLDDRLKVLTGGRRTAMPRHQTLRATFDWSYALLDPAAQAVFRRLSQFASTFSIEAACAVAADRVITAMSVTTSVGELAEKSLLGVEFNGPRTRYRLPESTRAYAREKLQDEGEVHSVAARHARYLQQRFEQWIEVAHAATDEPLDRLRHELDDARSALEWAFSPAGDDRLGVELTGALVEALLAWSLVEECYTRANRAITALVRLPSGTVDATCELRLRAALATALPHMSEAARLWHDVLLLATDKHNEEFQARALWGLWNAMLAGARIYASLMYAMLFQVLADERGIELQRILADHVVAVSLHSLGEHAEARALLERVLSGLGTQHYSASRPGELRADPSVVANGTLARIIWIQGEPDRAMALIDAAVDSVSADKPEPSLSHVLAAVAVPLALLSGDLPRAARYLDMLRAQARLHRFEIWRECCDCLGAHLDILTGQFDKGLRTLERALVALQARGFRRLLTPPLGVYAQAQAHAGHTAEARRILMETLAFCNENGDQIFSPDIWRILGVVALLEAHSAAAQGLSPNEYEADAQSSFLRAIHMAQQQGARMWELRAAVPLAQLWATQGRIIEATELLHPLCVLFPNPSVSSDVRTAHALMSELNQLNISTGEKLHVSNYGDRFGYFNSVDPAKSFPTFQGKQSHFASEQDFFYFNSFI